MSTLDYLEWPKDHRVYNHTLRTKAYQRRTACKLFRTVGQWTRTPTRPLDRYSAQVSLLPKKTELDHRTQVVQLQRLSWQSGPAAFFS